ncbi:hypothetical protein Ct61P_14645 [Colletotrichum tofieldiae]|nr:hypothetical protein Ct61P_14645 [Colletotrichum tofieldiae]
MNPGWHSRRRTSLVRTYQSLLDHTTNSEATSRPASESYATLLNPTSRLWPDTITPEPPFRTFEGWTSRTLGLRHEVARNLPVNVEAATLYPHNTHPFYEADDVVDTLLPGETDLTALLRHMAEMSMGTWDMVRQLSRHAAAAAPKGLSPKPTSPATVAFMALNGTKEASRKRCKPSRQVL